MENDARPLAIEPTRDDFILRLKPDRRARSRAQTDIARQALPPHDILLTRIRAEYQEMPGLRLTLAQAQRLCGVQQTLCQMVLDSLVGEKFLSLKSDGHYARLTGEGIERPQPAKADLRTAERTQKAS